MLHIKAEICGCRYKLQELGMSTYSPIRQFLEAQPPDHVSMTFKKVEQIVGRELPSSNKYPAWWSNNPSDNPMTKEWLSAGFRTEAVNIASETLVFRKSSSASVANIRFGDVVTRRSDESAGGSKPIGPSYFGCMKGALKVDLSVDLTAPADPDWGTVYRDD
jgi:hypothetical protein